MRKPRIKNDGEGYYHIVSRTALRTFLFNENDRSVFVKMMRKVEAFSGVEVMTYCVMANHFHILLHIPPKRTITPAEILERVAVLYGEERAAEMKERWEGYATDRKYKLLRMEQEQLRKRMGDLSEFVKTLKLRFTVWYQAHHNCDGTLWQGRFHSTLIEGSATALSTVAAYIDLNPVRAGIAKDPAEYRWSGYGSATRGLAISKIALCKLLMPDAEVSDFNKCMTVYRQLLFVKGSDVIDEKEVKKTLKNRGELPLPVMLRCKVRHFTSGVFLGSREFVEDEFRKHRSYFSPKRRTGARGIGMCQEWDGVRLCTARRLQSKPISI